MEEIINELKLAKKKKDLTNKQIAEATNVPEGTVARVFSHKEYNFKYDTIRPIVEYLITDDIYDEETPNPLPDENTIELLKHIIAEKNDEIEQYKEQLRAMAEIKDTEVTALKGNTKILRLIILCLAVSLLMMVVVDLGISGVGWFR